MIFKPRKLFFILYFLLIQNDYSNALNIKSLARVNDKIITSEDLKKEKAVLNFINNKPINSENFEEVALNNLIELNIKEIEINNEKTLVTEIDSKEFLIKTLEQNNKSLEILKIQFGNEIYVKYFIKRIQIELSWNKLILKKFSYLININMDEILEKNKFKNNKINDNDIQRQVIIEKNKKLEALSETYFNEIKSKSLIQRL